MFSSYKTPVFLLVTFAAGVLVSYPLVSRAEPQRPASQPAAQPTIVPVEFQIGEISKPFLVTDGDSVTLCEISRERVRIVDSKKIH